MRVRPISQLALAAALLLSGCGGEIDGYLPASAISSNGFLKAQEEAGELQGRQIKLWGFVDHGNLYGDASARAILKEWWSGKGPNPDTWRFDLKANADDAVGHAFAVYVPNDAGRERLLRGFVADARAGIPTQVFVTGRVSVFDAPAQVTRRKGLFLELESSQDIHVGSAAN